MPPLSRPFVFLSPGKKSTKRQWQIYHILQFVAISVTICALIGLTACDFGPASTVNKTYTIATILPSSGPDADVGIAMQRAVDLAVQQNTSLGKGYTLSVTHIDSAANDPSGSITNLLTNNHVLGIVGPLGSQTALTVLPIISQSSIATISPTATLPGLTLSDQATAEGLSFNQLHPQGKPVAFFRLPANDLVGGRVAADFAVAPAKVKGLAANAVFVVDDGSVSGKTLASAFIQELKAKGGSVAGQQTLVIGAQDNTQAIVTSIIQANPDIVFYAGEIAQGNVLRNTLTLTGVPQLVVLTVGSIANDPGWSKQTNVVQAAAYTTGILPAQDLSKIASPRITNFLTAYQAAYPTDTVLPQSALAYDAAMDEIAAIKALVTNSKPLTRMSVLSGITTAKYIGITGTISFDQNGDDTTTPDFSVYTCDIHGNWKLQTLLNG